MLNVYITVKSTRAKLYVGTHYTARYIPTYEVGRHVLPT